MAYLLTTTPGCRTRLKRIYVYHWRAAPGDNLFDSGLLDAAGRPGRPITASSRAIGRRGE